MLATPLPKGLEALAVIERTHHEGILALRLAHRKVSTLEVELLEALQHELVAQIPAQGHRLTKQFLRAPTLERIERAKERQDQAALGVWAAAKTHAHLRENLRRTLRK